MSDTTHRRSAEQVATVALWVLAGIAVAGLWIAAYWGEVGGDVAMWVSSMLLAGYVVGTIVKIAEFVH